MTNLSPNISSSKLARCPRRVPFECRPVCSEGSITRSIRCLYFSQLQHVWIVNCVKLKNIYIGRLEHDALTRCNHGSMNRFWSYLYFRFAAPYTTNYINTLFLVTKIINALQNHSRLLTYHSAWHGLWFAIFIRPTLWDGLTRKSCCSFGFCPNEGGEPKFFVTFS